MIDFEIFDKASRGAWGSFLLLFRTRGRSLAALGAGLTLLLLATDTFCQQVTDYPDRWTLEDASSTIAGSIRYKLTYIPEFWLGWESSQYDMNAITTVQKFLYGNGTCPVQSGNATRPDIPLSCPASNCTWPVYDTLAVCSQCTKIDASDLLTFACLDTTIDWSAHSTGPTKNVPSGQVCGYFVNATSDKPTMMSAYIVPTNKSGDAEHGEALLVRALSLTELYTKRSFYGIGSIHFKDLKNTLLDALFVSAADGPKSVYSKQTPVVHECVLSWCVKSVKSSYTWGGYEEEVTAVSQNTSAGPWAWKSFEVPEDEGGGWDVTYLEDVNVKSPTSSLSRTNATAPSQPFGANSKIVANVMARFDDSFPSYYTSDSATSTSSLRYKNYIDGPSIRTLEFNAWQSPNDIVCHMQRLAVAMTNVMRSNAESNSMVSGLAYNRKQLVLVRWEWLTFPLALLVLSFGFLTATIISTTKDGQDEFGIWKTSAMPTLIYSLPKEVQQDMKVKPLSQGQVGKVKIKLPPAKAWRVSGHVCASPGWTRKPNHQPPPGWI